MFIKQKAVCLQKMFVQNVKKCCNDKKAFMKYWMSNSWVSLLKLKLQLSLLILNKLLKRINKMIQNKLMLFSVNIFTTSSVSYTK
jgi:hypothetical protein